MKLLNLQIFPYLFYLFGDQVPFFDAVIPGTAEEFFVK